MTAVESLQELGFRQPAEWEPHEACWIAWPSHADLWGDALPRVQADFTILARLIAEGERLEVLVRDDAGERDARAAIGVCGLHRIPYGDIWLRDTGPLFLVGPGGEVAAACFAFNGWGGKYVLAGDSELAGCVAAAARVRTFRFPWILEGGSVEVDGQGTGLTTRQCLLHPNRNPGLDAGALERGLGAALGIEKVLWLGDGLRNDHTDGHVDTLARFVAPGRVVCMEARDAADPNREALAAVLRDLSAMTDARGRRLEIARVPSPGRVLDAGGELMPASYVNFYIGNRTIAVPTYGALYDAEAVERIGVLFPSRRTVGVPAKTLLAGGGAFHCITQQQPRGRPA